MKTSQKTGKQIGILTSGGDCAGLNATLRAVVHRAIGTYGWEVVGIRKATQGLMCRPPQVMSFDINSTRNLLTAGGTVLGTTNKGNPFAFPMPDGTLCDRS
ncbi:MAG: 6-phosphofructokinase, partial [Cyanobacteria bacterium P01_G01_bin.38]